MGPSRDFADRSFCGGRRRDGADTFRVIDGGLWSTAPVRQRPHYFGFSLGTRPLIVSTLAAFSGFLRCNELGIVLGSAARKIIMDDVPSYLAFDARVTVLWRPFFGVIEGADHNTVSLRATDSKRAAAVS